MKTKEEGTRGTVICVALGLGAAALGGMLYLASASEGAGGGGHQETLAVLGTFLLAVGLPMFALAILVELFSVRTDIARAKADVSLLLRTLAPPSLPASRACAATENHPPVADANMP